MIIEIWSAEPKSGNIQSTDPEADYDYSNRTSLRYSTTRFSAVNPLSGALEHLYGAIVELWRQGISAEEIESHLPHLTLAQVFDALSYYSDHTSEINSYIEANRIPDELIQR